MKTPIVLLLIFCSFVHANRPNILLIVTDDQAPHTLSAYGNKDCDTPHIDQLASSGIILDQAYHMGSMSGAVCSPSRTMIMSGRTLWHLPSRGKKQLIKQELKTGEENVLNNTLPAVFNREGYETFRTCKKGNSYSQANALFQIVKDKTARKAGSEDGSQWHGQQLLDYLDSRTQRRVKKPFFAYFGFSHPHDERWGRDDLNHKYGAKNVKSPPNEVNNKSPRVPISWLPKHPFPDGHPNLRDEVRVPGVMTSRTEATVRNELGREYACIENIDDQIGLVVNKLKEMGEFNNTYIIYTADHGIAVGRHGLMGKQNLYEHSWRVPFIVRGPGIKPGSRAKGNNYLLDILPTVCDLAGIDIPRTAQGKSLMSVLMGKTQKIRNILYGAYCGGTKPGMRSLRKGDWKLIKYDTMEGAVRKTQLFNLKENPDELLIEHHHDNIVLKTGNRPKKNQVNLANNPSYAKKLKEMESILLEQMEKLDDPYRLWDQNLKKNYNGSIKP